MEELIKNLLSKLGGGKQEPKPVAPKLSYDEALKQLQAKGWTVTDDQAAAPSQVPSATPQASANPMIQNTPQATPIAIPQEQLAQNISSTWGQDTPLLNDLALYMEAGNRLPGNMEKLLPIALALRETQGGKDNINPLKNRHLGKNNVFNIRHAGKFVDYPDISTAILGGPNPAASEGRSSGVLGLLSGDKNSNRGIYADFRKTNNYDDLFKAWSNPEDGNGPLDEQKRNIEFILNRLKNGR